MNCYKKNKNIYTDSSFKENYGWRLKIQKYLMKKKKKGKLSLQEYDM